MQPMNQMQTEDENLGGIAMEETPLVGILSLENNVDLGEPMHQVSSVVEDTAQDNELMTNELTWNVIEDVLREDIGEESENVTVTGKVGPHTPVNTSPTSEVQVKQMWVSASDLAKALAKFVKKTGLEEGLDREMVPQVQSVEPMLNTSTLSVPECCRNGTCTGETRDSPRSPEVESVEERDREWRSDTSENEGREPYRPEVSSISSEVVSELSGKNSNTKQGEKRKGSGPQGRTVRRIAHIRPRTASVRRRAMLQRRRHSGIPEFRMSIQAPVVQTHDVISRITLADGNVLEESMRLRCAMAEDVMSQTEITMEMMTVAFGERLPIGEEEEEPRNVLEGGEVIDLTTDEQTEGESDGTPVQDERKM
jgi:hypothetical protein